MASSGGSFLSDKLYDKTHVRWKPASGGPQGDRSGGAFLNFDRSLIRFTLAPAAAVKRRSLVR